MRLSTGMADLDMLLGGRTSFGAHGVVSDYGLRRPSVVLLRGAPGAGATTALLQIGGHVSRKPRGERLGRARVVYVSGDESAEAMQMKAERLDIAHGSFLLMGSSSMDSIESEVRRVTPLLLLVDRVQSMVVAGKKCRTRVHGEEIVKRLRRMSDTHRMCVVCVASETKDGSLGALQTLAHRVDAVVSMHREGETCLFTCKKNRHGHGPSVSLQGLEHAFS